MAIGPFRPGFWRSPLRGPWFTAVLGLALLVGLPLSFVTGLLSYAAYNPTLGGPANDRTPGKGFLGFYLFDWPTGWAYFYQLTQGIHVIGGLVLVPILLAKLWSVIPRFFAWPPVRSLGHAIERLSLVPLVGGAVFEFATGIMNIQNWYAFPVGFYTAHFYGAWIFLAGLVIHVVAKVRPMLAALRGRPLPASRDLESPDPAPATISRRGALGLVGAGSLLLFLVSVGENLGSPLRRLALLAPRGGTDTFPVNKTAHAAGITNSLVGKGWRLELIGTRRATLTLDELRALPQHTYTLPLACVEGWATTRTWTGVRLRDLAKLAGMPDPAAVTVESLQRKGTFRAARLRRNQILDERSLLALGVDGGPLALDHGRPARVIVPGNPGVHNTKWVARMTFESPTQDGI